MVHAPVIASRVAEIVPFRIALNRVVLSRRTALAASANVYAMHCSPLHSFELWLRVTVDRHPPVNDGCEAGCNAMQRQSLARSQQLRRREASRLVRFWPPL